jgi:mevalonate kinase
MGSLSFFARGKLLLTGEYAVLDGATALALPTIPGQKLQFIPQSGTSMLQWESIDVQGTPWFSATWDLDPLQVVSGAELPETQVITSLLSAMMEENGLPATFFEGKITTRLDFPGAWGLGTSSTLIALLARWTGVNAYRLLEKSFGGSGYDIAAAYACGPIFYRVNPENKLSPLIRPAPFQPDFMEFIYFLYSGKKQNSREGIAMYRKKPKNPAYLEEISDLSEQVVETKNFPVFCELMKHHEHLTGNQLEQVPVQKRNFSDFPGVIKSLGAWGGDFLLVLSDMPRGKLSAYFAKKGYATLLSYREIIFFEN